MSSIVFLLTEQIKVSDETTEAASTEASQLTDNKLETNSRMTDDSFYRSADMHISRERINTLEERIVV